MLVGGLAFPDAFLDVFSDASPENPRHGKDPIEAAAAWGQTRQRSREVVGVLW